MKKTTKKSKKTTNEKTSDERGKIILIMTMTLDGFLAGPKNELDWMTGILGTDPEDIKDNLEILKSYDTGIMGYPALAGMIPFWKQIAEDPNASKTNKDIANIVNNYKAYALSKKEEPVPNENTEIIVVKNDSDIIEAVKSIKERVKKNIGIGGGIRTAQTLSRLGLIDEYILTIHPVAIGKGKPLFIDKMKLELVNTKAYKNGVIRSKYRPVENFF